jgi:transcriptional regulator with XRE-family HTH domain
MGKSNNNLLPTLEENGHGRRRKRSYEITLGERIRLLRREAGLSQEDLGQSSGMSTSYISRLETGEVNPTVEALSRIVKVFGLTIDTVLDAEGATHPLIETLDFDPEIRSLLFKLKGRRISERTKRLLEAVIEEELRENSGG